MATTQPRNDDGDEREAFRRAKAYVNTPTRNGFREQHEFVHDPPTGTKYSESYYELTRPTDGAILRSVIDAIEREGFRMYSVLTNMEGETVALFEY